VPRPFLGHLSEHGTHHAFDPAKNCARYEPEPGPEEQDKLAATSLGLAVVLAERGVNTGVPHAAASLHDVLAVAILAFLEIGDRSAEVGLL